MNQSNQQSDVAVEADKSLACIHCGLCLSSCPTYLETGNENESPRGRIYLMRGMSEGRIEPTPSVTAHIDSCLGCRACEAACPSGVEYGELLEAARADIGSRVRRPLPERLVRQALVGRILTSSARTRWALTPARLLRRLGLAGLLPGPLRDAVELVPPFSHPVSLPLISPSTADRTIGRIGFLRGCVMDAMFAETNLNSVRLLTRLGYEVVAPNGGGCCGALAAHEGNLEEARRLARRIVKEFEGHTVDAVVVNAAGCGSAMKEYGRILGHESAQAMAFANRVKDLVEILFENDIASRLSFDSPSGPVTYHDACHLAHAQGITHAPRQLVKRVAGSSYVELPESDLCCGSAGSYNLTRPVMARRLGRRKARNVVDSGALTVVTTNSGCIAQMRASLLREGRAEIEVKHIADWLAERIRER